MDSLLLIAVAMLATGCVAGVLAGLFGIGGGIVIVPVLEAVLGFAGVDAAVRMHIAVATSLATIIPTSIASARSHHRRGAVNTGIARRWFGFVFAGAILGAWIASEIDGRGLALIFATLASFVAVKMSLFPETRNLTKQVPASPLVTAIPTGIGCLSAMMGIGGGILSVMTLRLFNEPMHRAVGTAALFGLAISLPGTIGFMITGFGDERLPVGNLGFVSLVGFALLAPTTILLAPVGARIAHALSGRKLSFLFGLFLVVAAARLFYRALA